MGRPDFDKLFEASSLYMLAAFTRSSSGGRPDEKGAPREHQLKSFFKDWLPEKYGVSKGYVLDLSKNVSKECDVVIYDNETCPKFIYDEELDVRFFPKNEIYGTFEVKSTLNNGELVDSLGKIESVKSISTGTIHDYHFGEEYENERNVKLAEVGNNDPYSSRSSRYIRDEEYQDYKLKFEKEEIDYSDTFCGLFAYKLGKDFSMEELKEKLIKTEYPPEIVVVLEKGVLVKTDKTSLKRLKALQQNKTSQDFIRDIDITFEVFTKTGFSGERTDYILVENDSQATNLMYFYTFVLDFLKEHRKYPNSYSADIISVWKQ